MSTVEAPAVQQTPDELVINNMGLVGSIAYKITTTSGIEYMELFQEGCIGLIKAARTFDHSKGFKFATYATRCITNEMLLCLRKGRTAFKCDSLELTPGWWNVGKFDSDLTAIEIDQKALDNIPAKQKKVLTLLYQGYNQREVAAQMGLSQTYVSRLVRRARSNYEKTSGFRF